MIACLKDISKLSKKSAQIQCNNFEIKMNFWFFFILRFKVILHTN